MRSDRRVRLGRRGETIAVDALGQRGYQVVERNWRCSVGEVDVVARQGDVWYFFEVRTRRGPAFGSPEESLTAAKQQRMVSVALTYLEAHDVNPYAVDWRIGLVAVEMGRNGRLERLEVYDSIT